MKFVKLLKLTTAALLASALTGCIGAVVGVAVDTTVAVVKAPFQIAGAVIGAAADTTGTVIAAPFRAVDAAFGDDHEHDGETTSSNARLLCTETRSVQSSSIFWSKNTTEMR